MKAALQTVLLIFAITFISPVLYGDAIVSIGSVSTFPGLTVNLPIDISSVTDLYGFQFDVLYDPAIVQLLSIDEGDFLSSTGLTFFIPGSIDNTAGLASFTANTLLGAVSGASGTGILAIFNFQPIAVGTTSLDISNVLLLDSNLDPIPFTVSSGQISSISLVPEPTTFVLVATGLGLLLVVKRKILGIKV